MCNCTDKLLKPDIKIPLNENIKKMFLKSSFIETIAIYEETKKPKENKCVIPSHYHLADLPKRNNDLGIFFDTLGQYCRVCKAILIDENKIKDHSTADGFEFEQVLELIILHECGHWFHDNFYYRQFDEDFYSSLDTPVKELFAQLFCRMLIEGYREKIDLLERLSPPSLPIYHEWQKEQYRYLYNEPNWIPILISKKFSKLESFEGLSFADENEDYCNKIESINPNLKFNRKESKQITGVKENQLISEESMANMNEVLNYFVPMEIQQACCKLCLNEN